VVEEGTGGEGEADALRRRSAVERHIISRDLIDHSSFSNA